MPRSVSPIPLDPNVAHLVEQLDDNHREAFEERAGILEFEAQLPRLEAERQALLQTLARYGFPGIQQVRLLQAEIEGATQWVLTSDEKQARQVLSEQVVSTVAEVDLVDVLHAQYGGLAYLSTSP